MGVRLNRSPSTISYELSRCPPYQAELAQTDAEYKWIEQDFEKDPKHELIITIGSYNYSGTAGMGRGYHIHGSGQFINEGAYFDQMKAQFDWIRTVLVVKIHDVEQKI
ncbi:FMN-binding protein [Pediococcus damnosus]|nr:FMN-binding protein [Pediococcus damnosus]